MCRYRPGCGSGTGTGLAPARGEQKLQAAQHPSVPPWLEGNWALKQGATKYRLHCNSCSLQTVGELGLAPPRAARKHWATGDARLAQYLLAFNQPAGLVLLFASTQNNRKSKVPLCSQSLADLL